MSFTFNIHVTVDLSNSLKEWIMSVLSDKIATVTASVDAATTRVLNDLTSLKNQVATLQAQIDAGGASQADLDALAALQAKLDAIDPTVAATLPG